MKIRDRIKEFRRVKASELHPNPKNWRTHPKEQMDALRGILAEVGFAGAELVRELPDGTLQLIDGHARAEVAGDNEVPVLVLDVTESEADKILLTFDPLGSMAEANTLALDGLLRNVETGNQALADMLTELANKASLYAIDQMADTDVDEESDDDENADSLDVNLFSCPVSVDQEIVIRKAIAEAKRAADVTTTGDALQVLAEAYLAKD